MTPVDRCPFCGDELRRGWLMARGVLPTVLVPLITMIVRSLRKSKASAAAAATEPT